MKEWQIVLCVCVHFKVNNNLFKILKCTWAKGRGTKKVVSLSNVDTATENYNPFVLIFQPWYIYKVKRKLKPEKGRDEILFQEVILSGYMLEEKANTVSINYYIYESSLL